MLETNVLFWKGKESSKPNLFTNGELGYQLVDEEDFFIEESQLGSKLVVIEF